ncbi:MAG TPA: NAD-dependent epimerase/dehydratase family protein [Thermoleophilaceae bacterium]|nr:NAD-dependent epimerase/dehydratase family protein [Thermoleophilaceae bacterium]
MTICVTGATGFIGSHVAELASGQLGPVRVTYRDESRLDRLGDADLEPVRADILDRAALRRAFRGCEIVFHAAGYVGSRPAARVWEANALAPRLAVEAAAAEGVRRVVVTSSVAGIGPAPPDRPGTEDDPYLGGGLGLAYPDAKHEGESEALAAGTRLGVEVVIVNPSYVFGPAVDPSHPGETSNRLIGNYLMGRLPAVVDSETNAVDVRDVAAGHLLAASKGSPGERYVLGGHDLRWVDLIERVARISGVRHALVVLPPEAGRLARRAEALGLASPLAGEGVLLMAQNWRYSSAKARRELGYRARPLDRTLRDTIDWYRELIETGALDGSGRSPMSLAASGVRLAGRAGLLAGLRVAERYTGRRLVVGA